MSAQSVTLAGRRAAESRMGAPNGGSTITVRRKTSDTTRNPANGTEVPVWPVVAANVPARLSHDTSQRRMEQGGVEWSAAARRVDVPMSYAGQFRDGDCVDVTAGTWAGMALVLKETRGKDQATALRMPAEEMDRPDEWG